MQTGARSESEIEIKRAAQLSITEVALGSLGHGFKIPLTGQILSLNQLGFLLNALNFDNLSKSSAFEISSIAAVLKSFSPAGQKIGPMLSIAMQGFLFWSSVTVFGAQLFGQVVGAVLLCLWSFVQPLLTLALIYGTDFEKLFEFYVKKVSEDYSFWAMAVGYALATVLIVKVLLALSMVVFSLKFKKRVNVIDPSQVSGMVSLPVSEAKAPWRGALRDLFRPVFLLSFVLMLLFVSQLNGTWGEKIWHGLRPLATAYILFYLLRSPWFHNKIMELSKRSPLVERTYEKAKKALKIMRAKDLS